MEVRAVERLKIIKSHLKFRRVFVNQIKFCRRARQKNAGNKVRRPETNWRQYYTSFFYTNACKF